MKKTISLLTAVIMVLCMAIPAFAAEDSFTPSVEVKGAPVIVPQAFDGDMFDALVLDEDEEVIEGIDEVTEENPAGEIIVTAYSEIETADSRVNVVYMEESYEEVLDAQSLKELNEAIPEGMVVRDFFDITLVGTYENMFEEGKLLCIKFDLGVDANENIQVLTRCSDETGWQFVKSVTNNGDGTVTVIFHELCPVIFLTDSSDVKVESPATSDISTAALWFVTVLCGAGAICMLVTYKKRGSVK